MLLLSQDSPEPRQGGLFDTMVQSAAGVDDALKRAARNYTISAGRDLNKVIVDRGKRYRVMKVARVNPVAAGAEEDGGQTIRNRS